MFVSRLSERDDDDRSLATAPNRHPQSREAKQKGSASQHDTLD